ncbi:MAG: PLP-dependent aminotransferase family protein [Gammaproteobacteria bacterium]|nr:PLP-dependent aminotransferase family protein [Gammaproteobacteria bacterium]
MLYRSIADALAKQIAEGVYVAGDRLPSIRDACENFRVSISTIQRAYWELENRRLAEARPQSGYYVLPRNCWPASAEVPPSADDLPEPVTINQGVFHLFSRQQTENFLNLGLAYPSPEFLPVTQIRRILRKLSRFHLEGILTPDGTADVGLKLRRQLAQMMLNAGCEVNCDEVVTTAGCKDALAFCLGAIVHRGDIVAVETPTFPGFLQLLEALGAQALEIPTDPVNGIGIDALELALEQWPIKACVLVPTCHNPVGFTMPEDRRRRLVDLAHAAQLPVIEDDIYGDLSVPTPRLRALKAYDRDGLVLYCSSVSKSMGGGLRVGWACPGKFISEVRRLKALHGVAENTLSGMVVTEFLASRGYERHMRRLVTQFQRVVCKMIAAIHAYFPEGTAAKVPTGGYVVWVQLPHVVDSWALYRLALAKNILILPGRLFAASGRYRSHFRISAAVPWNQRAEDAVRCLGALVSDLVRQGRSSPHPQKRGTVLTK